MATYSLSDLEKVGPSKVAAGSLLAYHNADGSWDAREVVSVRRREVDTWEIQTSGGPTYGQPDDMHVWVVRQ